MKKFFLPALLFSLCATAFAGDPSLRGSILEANMPVEKSRTRWADGDYFFGDWGGARTRLAEAGVTFDSYYVMNPAANVSGGKKRGGSYVDNFYLGVSFDLEKLLGWRGLTLAISGINRSGGSTTEAYVGSQYDVQQVHGGQNVFFYNLTLEQRFWDDKAKLKIGRFGASDDFNTSPIYGLYMNNGIDGNPQALPVNTGFSCYPSSTWGARVRIDPTPEFYAMAGIYQTSPRYGNRGYHGLNWEMRDGDGVILLAQAGWTPEFFKEPVPVDSGAEKSASAPDGKAVADGKTAKSFREPATVMKGLKGHYWFGAYDSPTNYAQFGTSEQAYNSFGFYWHADQMVFQEAPGSDQGLTVWSAFVLSPQQNIAKLPFQVNGGLVYKGLIPTRDEDQTTFGVVYGRFSDDYADSVEDALGGRPEYELVFEWGYRVQFTRFLYVQPNMQYVVNPGGSHTIPNALVLGAQCGVTF